jgi:hypothetical protein
MNCSGDESDAGSASPSSLSLPSLPLTTATSPDEAGDEASEALCRCPASLSEAPCCSGASAPLCASPSGWRGFRRGLVNLPHQDAARGRPDRWSH